MEESADLRSGSRKLTKKKELLQVGYESDSEDNDYDSEEENSADNVATKADDDNNDSTISGNGLDDDMFASEDEKEDGNPTLTKSKGFNMDEFEKEHCLGKYDDEAAPSIDAKEEPSFPESDKGEAHDYYNNIEDYDGDERRPYVKHELQIEAFNLREEAETGTFDKDMNYVKEKNSDDENEEDAWMAGIKNSEIKKAREAQQKSTIKKSKLQSSQIPTESLLGNLISLLEPAETPMEALIRLRPNKSRRNKKIVDEQQERVRKDAVLNLTECCEQLSNHKGIYSVYDLSREELMRLYYKQTGEEFRLRGVKRGIDQMENEDEPSQEEITGNESNGYGEKIWEYRWVDNRDEILGTYSSYEMNYWKETYFNNEVEVRRVGQEEFEPISEVVFST